MSDLSLDKLLSYKRIWQLPRTVVHCGSTRRAMAAFQDWQLRDTLAGFIVLTIGANKHDGELALSEGDLLALDILHLFKIEQADLVRILNVGGYIGPSTRRELEYARRLGKEITFLEPEE